MIGDQLPEHVPVPDLIEPLHGYRAWRLERTADGWALRSTSCEDLWPPRQAPAAGCRERCAAAVSPEHSCSCGWYAWRSERQAISHADALLGFGGCRYVVWGEIQAWGKVIEHELGLRAERAAPLRLWLQSERRSAELPAIAAALSERYGIPCQVARRMAFTPANDSVVVLAGYGVALLLLPLLLALVASLPQPLVAALSLVSFALGALAAAWLLGARGWNLVEQIATRVWLLTALAVSLVVVGQLLSGA